MAANWIEVDKALSEGRRELVLTGPSVAERLSPANGGRLDERIFTIVNLNFLEISKSGLQTLPDLIGGLENLTNLGLDNNSLTQLPPCIGLLKKLKFLDVSFNQLSSLPVELGSLKDLQTLNVIQNKLTTFVNISGMVQLHSLDVSHNELTELPEGITDDQLALLATVAAHHNQIVTLPTELYNLSNLKLLDVSDNKIEEIPPEFCECGKLKDLKYGGNNLKDKRLAKMVNGCSTKAVLDYLRNIRDKELKLNGGKKPAGAAVTTGGAGDKEKKKKGKGSNQEDNKAQSVIKVLHFVAETGLTVQVTTATATVRPYIVCCIVRNVNFIKSDSMMRRFLIIQVRSSFTE